MREIEISEHVRLLQADDTSQNNYAVVTFGGIAQGLGMPVFEFFQTLGALGVDSLFIRDPAQGWYSKSIPGLGARPSEMAAVIRGLVASHFPNRQIVAVGNSMGGFAALMFGALCGFRRVLCFSPQTFISRELRLRHRDDRWPNQIAAIPSPEFDDVVPLVHVRKDLITEIYVGRRDHLDFIHAERLRGAENVILHVLDYCGHDASRYLKNQGRLSQVLSSVFVQEASVSAS